MPTNLAIDDELLDLAKKLGGRRTKREVVNEALLEYVQRRKRLASLNKLGTIEFDRDFNYKRARNRR